MSRLDRPEINLNSVISEYQNIKTGFDIKLQNLSNLAMDKFKEYEINIVIYLTKWSQEKNIY